jgi:hypothetical protein
VNCTNNQLGEAAGIEEDDESNYKIIIFMVVKQWHRLSKNPYHDGQLWPKRVRGLKIGAFMLGLNDERPVFWAITSNFFAWKKQSPACFCLS